MSAQVQIADKGAAYSQSQAMPERSAWYLPGVPMLLLGIILLAGAIVSFWQAAQHHDDAVSLGWTGAILILAGIGVLRGLTAVVPGRAHVVQLFGRYQGTVRESGLQWVNPFANRVPVSTRIRNLESSLAKVNDADGNPIEIAAVVVWQVQDTAYATYAVDDYPDFVAIQTETAVRHIASSYPYDNRGSGALSLRDNADEITQRLSSELTDRVRSAGVHVIETRLTSGECMSSSLSEARTCAAPLRFSSLSSRMKSGCRAR